MRANVALRWHGTASLGTASLATRLTGTDVPQAWRGFTGAGPSQQQEILNCCALSSQFLSSLFAFYSSPDHLMQPPIAGNLSDPPATTSQNSCVGSRRAASPAAL